MSRILKIIMDPKSLMEKAWHGKKKGVSNEQGLEKHIF